MLSSQMPTNKQKIALAPRLLAIDTDSLLVGSYLLFYRVREVISVLANSNSRGFNYMFNFFTFPVFQNLTLGMLSLQWHE